MNHKVLLADDSPTIQKVIKITLANRPYEITEASSEHELFQKLPILQPKLVLLDFNLSDKFNGYELTKKIKSVCPSAKVLLLLGTFDNVDDDSMEKSGASDKIVKPFDSNKFISICKKLVDTFPEEEISFPSPKSDVGLDTTVDEDQWTMGHSAEQKLPEFSIPEAPVSVHENPLLKEVSDWGMSVPGVINQSSIDNKMIDLPPVIGEELRTEQVPKISKQEIGKDQPKYPDNDDLDYPTHDEVNLSVNEVPSNHPGLELELESYPTDFGGGDVKNIEAQIRDEVEENLWKVDEFEDIKKEVANKIEDVKSNFKPSLSDFNESLFKPIDDSQSITWDDAGGESHKQIEAGALLSDAHQMENLKREMEELVKRYVKEYMDQMFQKNAEKIAWEVIPDLAENLIRKELSKISNKILNNE